MDANAHAAPLQPDFSKTPGAAGGCPPSVTRGAKPLPRHHGAGRVEGEDPAGARSASVRARSAPGVFLTVDWLRFVGPAEREQDIRDYLARATGSPDSEPVKAQHFYQSAELYAGGVRFQRGHSHESASVYVEWNGRALDSIPEPQRVQIVRDMLALGMHATRIDIAADFIMQNVGLFDNGLKSCEAGQLCGARVFRPVYERTHLRFMGKTLYLGRRGEDGSGKFARGYDKGLETGTMDEGEWERLECEYSSKHAERVARRLADADEPEQSMRELLYGSFEFREVNGRRELERRPMLAWWARIVELIQVARIRIPRTRSTLQRFSRWYERCVAPSMLAMAKAAGMSADQLTAHLAPEAEPKACKPGSVLEEWGAYLRDGIQDIAEAAFEPIRRAGAEHVWKRDGDPEDLSWANFAT